MKIHTMMSERSHGCKIMMLCYDGCEGRGARDWQRMVDAVCGATRCGLRLGEGGIRRERRVAVLVVRCWMVDQVCWREEWASCSIVCTEWTWDARRMIVMVHDVFMTDGGLICVLCSGRGCLICALF